MERPECLQASLVSGTSAQAEACGSLQLSPSPRVVMSKDYRAWGSGEAVYPAFDRMLKARPLSRAECVLEFREIVKVHVPVDIEIEDLACFFQRAPGRPETSLHGKIHTA